MQEWQQLAALVPTADKYKQDRARIKAIKAHRAATKMGLADSREIVDAYIERLLIADL